MFRRPVLALLLGVVARSGSAAAGDSGVPAPIPPPDAAMVAEVATGAREFAFDLHRRLAAGGGNVFASPYSVSTALAMTTAGARGVTESELRRVLRLPEGHGRKYRELVRSVASIPMVPEYDAATKRNVPTLAYRLSIANAIYSQAGWKFLDSFRIGVAEDFFAEFSELDFRKPELARQTINDWVAKKTNDKIKDLMPAGLPKPDTRMVLANAIWFRGAWDEEFKEGATTDGPFAIGSGKDVVARMMHRVGSYAYAETPEAQVLEMPYKSGETSMVVILPKAKDGLAAVEKSVTGASFAAFTAAFDRKRVDLVMPKFQMTSAFDLVGVLKALGVKAAFDASQADFSGIAAPPEELFIGAILHKAFVAVDEHGTEAAAATAVVMVTRSSVRPEAVPIPFHVDHPFLFAIRHVPSGAILFLGRVADPTLPN